MNGIDVHCHLEYMNADEVVAEAKQKMATIITSVADPKDIDKILSVHEKYPDFVFVSLGFHPERISKYSQKQIDEYIEKIRQNRERIVAVGEVGLDYNWIREKEKQEKSKEIFLQFIELSKDMKLPLVIHARNSMDGKDNAFDDVLKILSDNGCKNVVLHCFSGSETNLREALEQGYWISYATNIARSDKHKRLASKTPLENMLLETDAPWLDPFSKELENRPWNIRHSAGLIANIKKVSIEEVLEKTTENARKAFGL